MDLLKLEEATSKRYIKPTIRFCAGSLGLSDKEAEAITGKHRLM